MRQLLALLWVAAALAAVGCDTDEDAEDGDGGPVHNNSNGYCWERPTDCGDLIPLEDDMHYQCCFSKYGYYCDTDGVLHEFLCPYACSYDAENDEIYCAEPPDAGVCQ